MFSRAVRWPVLRRRATASGRVVVERHGVALDTSARSGRIVVEVDLLLGRGVAVASTSASSTNSSGVALVDRVAGRDRDLRARCRATGRLITCSIFIASMTSSGWPAAHGVALGDRRC